MIVDSTTPCAVVENRVVNPFAVRLESVENFGTVHLFIEDGSVKTAQLNIAANDFCLSLSDALGLPHHCSDDRLGPFLRVNLLTGVTKKIEFFKKIAA
jgi:hypothetical protein